MRYALPDIGDYHGTVLPGGIGGMSELETTDKMSRRDFFGWGWAVFAGISSLFVFFLTALRMPMPSLLPGRSGRFKIGRKEDFPPGATKYFEEQQTYVFADQDGIFAISSVCTHLGCVVNKEETQFMCPCHGSRYSLMGKVTQGPAPKNLSWYSVDELPSGRLVVDRNRVVNPGVKFSV